MAVNREKALTAAAKFASKGQHDRAAKEYISIIEADPSDVRSWLLLAEALVNAGDKVGALERYLHVGKHYAEAGDPRKWRGLSSFVEEQDCPLGIVVDNGTRVRRLDERIYAVPVTCL